MIRRIWAIVSEADFYAFRDRARKSNLEMGPALAALVHLYAKGGDFDLAEHRNYYSQIVTGVDYVKEHRLDEVDKGLVGEKINKPKEKKDEAKA